MRYFHFTTQQAADDEAAYLRASGYSAYVLKLNPSTYEVRAW